jgi:hypothetical protein
MRSPCKECLVLSCCKGRILAAKDILVLGQECSKFYGYLKESYNLMGNEFSLQMDKETLLKYIEVRDIFLK